MGSRKAEGVRTEEKHREWASLKVIVFCVESFPPEFSPNPQYIRM